MLTNKLTGAGAADKTYIEDVFSTYLYTGNGANLTIENGLKNDFTNTSVTVTTPPSTSTNGLNLEYAPLSSDTDDGTPSVSTDSHKTNGRSVNLLNGGGYRNATASADFAYGTGDYCIELWVKRTANRDGRIFTHSDNYLNLDMNAAGGLGTYRVGATGAPDGSIPLNTWVHVAVTKSSNTVRIFVGGVLQTTGTYTTSYSTNRNFHVGISNGFNNGSFPGLIGDVRVYKGSAKYTSNFTPPTTFTSETNVVFLTSFDSSSAFRTGTLSTQVVNKHVMVWGKNRSNGNYHAISDTLRGGQYALFSNNTEAQRTSALKYIKMLTTSGIILGSEGDINSAGDLMVSWAFRQAPKFFDVVTYTGNGAASKVVSHSLGVSPGMVIVKKTSATGNWCTFFNFTGGNIASNDILYLNRTDAFGNFADAFYANASTFTVPNTAEDNNAVGMALNDTGATYVAYLFAHDTSTDGLIQCGSYTGNGSTTGPEINLGWEPQYVLVKPADLTGDWFIFDNMRGIANGAVDARLIANTSDAESLANNYLSVTATGFQITNNGVSINSSGATYIYMAIRRGPMRTPTDGTKVFKPVAATLSAGTTRTIGFPLDTTIFKPRTADYAGVNWGVYDRLRGYADADYGVSKLLSTNATDAESDQTSRFYAPWNTTVRDGSIYSGVSEAMWHFRRAPGFFDVVCYTGTGVARTVNHNLGVAPELMIVKSRSMVSDWTVYCKEVTKFTTGASTPPENAFARVNTDSGVLNAGTVIWNSTKPSATSLSLGSNFRVNESGATYVAYLFASCPGVSKVGSYTGNGSSQTINCGFTNGARFVLIKRTDSAGDWYVWDTARGIVAGNDPHLSLNTDAAEVTTNDTIDPDSTGFIVNQVAATNVNVSGGSYIYLAIA